VFSYTVARCDLGGGYQYFGGKRYFRLQNWCGNKILLFYYWYSALGPV